MPFANAVNVNYSKNGLKITIIGQNRHFQFLALFLNSTSKL